jgi:hypothetical protein
MWTADNVHMMHMLGVYVQTTSVWRRRRRGGGRERHPPEGGSPGMGVQHTRVHHTVMVHLQGSEVVFQGVAHHNCVGMQQDTQVLLHILQGPARTSAQRVVVHITMHRTRQPRQPTQGIATHTPHSRRHKRAHTVWGGGVCACSGKQPYQRQAIPQVRTLRVVVTPTSMALVMPLYWVT